MKTTNKDRAGKGKDKDMIQDIDERLEVLLRLHRDHAAIKDLKRHLGSRSKGEKEWQCLTRER